MFYVLQADGRMIHRELKQLYMQL